MIRIHPNINLEKLQSLWWTYWMYHWQFMEISGLYQEGAVICRVDQCRIQTGNWNLALGTCSSGKKKLIQFEFENGAGKTYFVFCFFMVVKQIDTHFVDMLKVTFCQIIALWQTDQTQNSTFTYFFEDFFLLCWIFCLKLIQ